MINQEQAEHFITRYKNWIIAVLGFQIIPLLLFLICIIGAVVYSYVGSEIRWHPYKQYIYGGYNAGLQDGNRDLESVTGPFGTESKYLKATPWYRYQKETKTIKEQALKEKDEYLAQFPESERGSKRAEMRAEGIKLPIEKEIEKRFKKAIDFYTDYVDKKIKRESYTSDQEYQQALCTEAWKVGYEYGYGNGWFGHIELDSGL